MKVKFENGVTKKCSAPLEQKLFRNIDGETVGVGWILMLKLTGGVTSADIDSVMTANNTSTLEFLTEDDSGEETTLFSLTGYRKITSSIVHYSEDTSSAYAEIQLTKGV